MRRAPIAALALVATTRLSIAAPVDEPIELEPVRVDAAAPADDARQAAPFVSVLPVPEQPAALETLGDLLEAASGVRVRRLGGPGSPASASVRGSAPGQVQFFLDGVPLDRTAFDVVDLTNVPLGALERVEVYRGTVPSALGAGAIGGAVHLLTRDAHGGGGSLHSLGAGVGFFGGRSADLARSATLGPAHYRLSVHYRGAEGDFPFYDDGGTPISTSDDRESTRVNAGSDAVDALVRVRVGERDGSSLAVVGLFGARARGVPGPASVQTRTAESSLMRGLLNVHGQVRDWPWARSTVRVSAHGVGVRERLDDPENELGRGPVAARDTSLIGGGRAVLEAGVGEHQVVEIVADARVERFAPGVGADRAGPAQRRTLAAASVRDDLFVWGDRVVVSGALRAERLTNRFDLSDDGTGRLNASSTAEDRLLWSPRVGFRLRLAPDLHLKSNVGRFYRVPALFELFGRRDVLAGNPTLEPERALNADVGLQLELGRGGHSLYAEVACFGSWIDDAIVFVPNSQTTLIGRNLGAARTVGVEVEAALRAPSGVELSGSYTLVDAQNRSAAPSETGRQLPGRARHDLSALLSWSAGPLRLGYRVTYLSGTFLDTPNLRPLPQRHLHDADLRWRASGGVVVSLEAKNLFDRRVEDVALLPRTPRDPETVPAPVSDFAAWPLPGRSIGLSFAWSG